MCFTIFPVLTLTLNGVQVDQTIFETGLMTSSLSSSPVKSLFLASLFADSEGKPALFRHRYSSVVCPVLFDRSIGEVGLINDEKRCNIATGWRARLAFDVAKNCSRSIGSDGSEITLISNFVQSLCFFLI